jgi:hypothetical protein
MRRTTCRHVMMCACSTAPENVHAMRPDRTPRSGEYTAARSAMHQGMIRKRKKHLHFTRSIKLRPFIKCACSTAPRNVHAMCPDRIRNSGDDTAARSKMHQSMIPKWRKHQHYMRRTTCRHVMMCACSTAHENVHVLRPDRTPRSGEYTAARSAMHQGMIRKRKKHLHFTRSIKLRPFIKCACSTAPQNVHAMCPDRIRNSGDDTAARSKMHQSMIPKWRKHQHYMRRTTCRHVMMCACSTAHENVHAMRPDRTPRSGEYTAARSAMHQGMIRKRKKHLHFTRSIKFRPFFKCACSTAPHKLHAM